MGIDGIMGPMRGRKTSRVRISFTKNYLAIMGEIRRIPKFDNEGAPNLKQGGHGILLRLLPWFRRETT
jgi:hypothetical protein